MSENKNKTVHISIYKHIKDRLSQVKPKHINWNTFMENYAIYLENLTRFSLEQIESEQNGRE